MHKGLIRMLHNDLKDDPLTQIWSPQTLPGRVRKWIKESDNGVMQGYVGMERLSNNEVRGDAT